MPSCFPHGINSFKFIVTSIWGKHRFDSFRHKVRKSHWVPLSTDQGAPPPFARAGTQLHLEIWIWLATFTSKHILAGAGASVDKGLVILGPVLPALSIRSGDSHSCWAQCCAGERYISLASRSSLYYISIPRKTLTYNRVRGTVYTSLLECVVKSI